MAAGAFSTDEAYAAGLDEVDPLAGMRGRFHLPRGAIYLLGNSLGLMTAAEASVLRVLDEWKAMGIGGWLGGDPPWFWLAERIGEAAAPLVGAASDEVVCTGTTTFDIHSLAGTFYRPGGGRRKIIASAADFPTDVYALESWVLLHGGRREQDLVLIEPGGDGFVDEERIIAAMTDEAALVHLPSVFYRSGQLLDIERLAAAARERGIPIGFDCSHSAGIVPHRLSEWGVDFAMWCGYKYLCGGPGAPAFLYVNRRHFGRVPALAGWFGYVKERQFDLLPEFEHALGAGGWQVSSPGILGAAAVQGALGVICEAGVEAIREKSLRLTTYLIELADAFLAVEPYRFRVATPREPGRRGGHVALARDEDALRIKEALVDRGVFVDFRPPDLIRLAPSPLHTSFAEVRHVVRQIMDIIDTRAYERVSRKRKPIS
ncbi:MAG: kynureninase [Candidatus Krumholzibacteria bacterium]|nr:kynureninase [Candidatus Krumholzibacteria bacterium]